MFVALHPWRRPSYKLKATICMPRGSAGCEPRGSLIQ